MTQMTQNHETTIIGGGMVGLTMAIALAYESIDVAVVEKYPLGDQTMPAFDGRVIAIAYGSKLMLDKLGIWQHLQAHAEPILDIRVLDGDAPFFLDYHHEEVGDQPFGWIVQNRHVRMGLQAELAKCEQVTLYNPASIISLSSSPRRRGSISCMDPRLCGDDKVNISLNTGDEIATNLVIAADGKRSATREMAGIGVREFGYQQSAIVCTIKHTLEHHGLAQERFLPVGPFAVLPMQNNHSSLVWVEPVERASDYAALPKVEIEQEIAERVGGYLGEIELAGEVFTYPLSLTIAKRYTAERLALIGDAAHSIHPIAGQGINLGFRDVAELRDVIIRQHQCGLDVGSQTMLSQYAKLRRVDIASMVMATDGLTRLFSNSVPPLKLARGLGLWGVSQLPPVKKIFMRHAMGMSGRQPELMEDA